MNPAETAEYLGCTPTHVCWLVRNGKLPATLVPTNNNRYGYTYNIQKRDARKLLKRKGAGRPRKNQPKVQ